MEVVVVVSEVLLWLLPRLAVVLPSARLGMGVGIG